ncbi:S8 family serine peptidase [Hyphobacterium sp. SN044]|uniref:S8 family serine peptidase n=1 Tax=Hyphobacterium sp. SN044 TaxID=2912575 RepID=UPI001F00CB8A|nr:S8 family serine peptidase [Hyphobacterium sp. SN044]MCF8879538.1 S8 family serine peptidase [Hyphobacterium sp. SN044]
MFRFLFTALAAFFTFASAALAAPVTLDGRAQARLEAGERARVMVWLAAPSAAEAAEAGIESDAASATIGEVSNDVMMRVFGVPAARLAAAAPGADEPRIAREFRYTPVLAMELSRDEIARLSQDAGVRRIEADELSRPILDQSVPLIGATALHNGGNTGAGVAVAILDTGVDHEHPMFAGRITGSACFSTTSSGSTSLCPAGAGSDTTTAGAGDNCEEYTDNNTIGAEGCSHGTHVAGIAAGGSFTDQGDASRTLRGVAPGANIVAVQVFSRFTSTSDCGSSTPCVLSYSSDQLAALEWLYTNRTTLSLASINMSLGGGKATTGCTSNSLAPVIGQLRTAGVATVIASGNEGFTDGVSSPGCVPDAITVGSTTKADALSGFSNSSPLVDVVAPGSSIRSAYPTINDAGAGRAATFNGTSMAAPHVAGAIALLRASRPTASIDAIENALEATGIPVTNGNNNVTSPRIRVDLADAQLAANSGGTVAGVMTVSPLIAFNASGGGSDGSNYGSRDYTLTNTSGSTITWQAVGSADWLVLTTVGGGADTPDGAASDTESGSLAAGASVVVRASVNPAGLSGGNYLGTITFTANGATPGLQVAASLAVGATAPVNDNFANALVLTQPSQVVAFNSTGATKQAGEPNHTSGGGASLWWSWTAPVSGQVRAETQSAGFDTMMGVYTGTAVNALSVVGQNDDIAYPSNTQSRVDFTATAGTTYRIAVDGYNGASGSANLSVSMLAAPANDNLASAQTLSGANGSVSASNVNATRETGESQHGGAAGGASVWFAWQAPASGPVSFTATGGSAALLAAYGANTHGGAAIAQSASGSIDFTAASGSTYYIALDGTGGAQGLFSLTWAQGPNPAHRLRAAVLPNARSVTVGNTATAFATVINPGSFGAGGTNCRIEPPANFNGNFTFRRTDSGTNAPIGSNGDTVSLAAGASQTYVMSMTPGAPMNGAVLAPVFLCDDVRATDPIPGVTTVTLSASTAQTADIVSIAATPTANGILDIPLNGARAFSVAAVNIGAAQTVTITPGTGGVTLPLTIDMCETNPATGVCLTGRTPTVAVNFAANESRTFTIFVRSTGAVAFTPSTNRVFVTFTNATPATVGATSVAARTQ